jgi:hypothetical protein
MRTATEGMEMQPTSESRGFMPRVAEHDLAQAQMGIQAALAECACGPTSELQGNVTLHAGRTEVVAYPKNHRRWPGETMIITWPDPALFDDCGLVFEDEDEFYLDWDDGQV